MLFFQVFVNFSYWSAMLILPLLLAVGFYKFFAEEISSRTRFGHRQSKKEGDPDAIIVGAGVAGGALALALADQGKKIVLLEKCLEEQDRIVGELLQPGGVEALKKLDLQDCVGDRIDSVCVNGYVVIQPSKDTKDKENISDFIQLYYPKELPNTTSEYLGFNVTPAHPDNMKNGEKTAVQGRSFHNSRFVQEMRHRAFKHPNITVIKGTVIKFLYEDDSGEVHNLDSADIKDNSYDNPRVVGVLYRDSDKNAQNVTADVVFVCDGIWSGLRKNLSDSEPILTSYFVGLVLQHSKPILPFLNFGHVVLADPTPILLYQISSTETRILVDITHPLPNATDGSLHEYLEKQIGPQLPVGVQPAFYDALKTQTPKTMPNRLLESKFSRIPGAYAIGDALNMRHPLTGGGMTVALKDVVIIRDLLESVEMADLHSVHKAMNQYFSYRTGHSAVVNILASALYQVFSTCKSEDPVGKSLRLACYDYLGKGGPFSAGPMGLLSGISPTPGVLIFHFFVVAFYAVKLAVSPIPTFSSLRRAYYMLWLACIIIMPLIEMEKTTFLCWFPVRTVINFLFPYKSLDRSVVLSSYNK